MSSPISVYVATSPVPASEFDDTAYGISPVQLQPLSRGPRPARLPQLQHFHASTHSASWETPSGTHRSQIRPRGAPAARVPVGLTPATYSAKVSHVRDLEPSSPEDRTEQPDWSTHRSERYPRVHAETRDISAVGSSQTPAPETLRVPALGPSRTHASVQPRASTSGVYTPRPIPSAPHSAPHSERLYPRASTLRGDPPRLPPHTAGASRVATRVPSRLELKADRFRRRALALAHFAQWQARLVRVQSEEANLSRALAVIARRECTELLRSWLQRTRNIAALRAKSLSLNDAHERRRARRLFRTWVHATHQRHLQERSRTLNAAYAEFRARRRAHLVRPAFTHWKLVYFSTQSDRFRAISLIQGAFRGWKIRARDIALETHDAQVFSDRRVARSALYVWQTKLNTLRSLHDFSTTQKQRLISSLLSHWRARAVSRESSRTAALASFSANRTRRIRAALLERWADALVARVDAADAADRHAAIRMAQSALDTWRGRTTAFRESESAADDYRARAVVSASLSQWRDALRERRLALHTRTRDLHIKAHVFDAWYSAAARSAALNSVCADFRADSALRTRVRVLYAWVQRTADVQTQEETAAAIARDSLRKRLLRAWMREHSYVAGVLPQLGHVHATERGKRSARNCLGAWRRLARLRRAERTVMTRRDASLATRLLKYWAQQTPPPEMRAEARVFDAFKLRWPIFEVWRIKASARRELRGAGGRFHSKSSPRSSPWERKSGVFGGGDGNLDLSKNANEPEPEAVPSTALDERVSEIIERVNHRTHKGLVSRAHEGVVHHTQQRWPRYMAVPARGVHLYGSHSASRELLPRTSARDNRTPARALYDPGEASPLSLSSDEARDEVYVSPITGDVVRISPVGAAYSTPLKRRSLAVDSGNSVVARAPSVPQGLNDDVGSSDSPEEYEPARSRSLKSSPTRISQLDAIMQDLSIKHANPPEDNTQYYLADEGDRESESSEGETSTWSQQQAVLRPSSTEDTTADGDDEDNVHVFDVTPVKSKLSSIFQRGKSRIL